jgi:hypothetical protein
MYIIPSYYDRDSIEDPLGTVRSSRPFQTQGDEPVAAATPPGAAPAQYAANPLYDQMRRTRPGLVAAASAEAEPPRLFGSRRCSPGCPGSFAARRQRRGRPARSTTSCPLPMTRWESPSTRRPREPELPQRLLGVAGRVGRQGGRHGGSADAGQRGRGRLVQRRGTAPRAIRPEVRPVPGGRLSLALDAASRSPAAGSSVVSLAPGAKDGQASPFCGPQSRTCAANRGPCPSYVPGSGCGPHLVHL